MVQVVQEPIPSGREGNAQTRREGRDDLPERETNVFKMSSHVGSHDHRNIGNPSLVKNPATHSGGSHGFLIPKALYSPSKPAPPRQWELQPLTPGKTKIGPICWGNKHASDEDERLGELPQITDLSADPK